MPATHFQRLGLSLLFVTGAAFAQTGLTFEVASVSKAQPLDVGTVISGKMNVKMTIDNAMVDVSAMSLSELLRYVYKVKSFQISGPDWLNVERYNIHAKMPPGSTRDQVPEMIGALLGERFKMTLHRSTTEQQVYALVVAKEGPKLKESVMNDTAAPGTSGPAAPLAATPSDGSAQVRAMATSDASGTVSASSVNGDMKMLPRENGMTLRMTKMNASGMVEVLGRFVDKPVIDQTGLTGRYDLDVDVGFEDMLKLAAAAGVNVPIQRPTGSASEPGGSSVFTAIQQFGLKLEGRKAPIELLIIDHVEKTPTEN